MTPRHLLEPGRLAGAALLTAQTDARLVDMTRAGNDRAFEAIVARHKGPLLRYCSRILRDGRAEDAVQQAFLNAYAALHRDTTPLSLRSWLFGIAHNVSLNLLRQRGAEFEPLGDHAGTGEAADATLERRERLREVLAAVAALPPGQRDALLLRELEGRGHDEIARELGVTGGAARQLISRARNGIREAAAAILPLPLLMRVTDGATPPPTTERLAELTAAGAGITVTKVVATAAVGGTLLGGAVTAPDLVEGERERRSGGVAEAADTASRGELGTAAGPKSPGNAEGEERGRGRSGRGGGGRGDDDGDRSGERDDDDDRSGPGDGDGERDDHSGRGGGDDEPDDRDDSSNSGRRGGRDDGGRDSDNSGPGSGDDVLDADDDNSGPGGGTPDPVDVIEPDDDAIEAEDLDDDSSNSGPGGGGD